MSVASDPIAGAFSAHGKRAALMPYLMGGYPSIEESVCGRAWPPPMRGPICSSSGSRSRIRWRTGR